MTDSIPPSGDKNQADAWADLVRLALKIGTVTDPDLRGALVEALDAKCEKLRSKLTAIPPQAAEIEELRSRFTELPILEAAPEAFAESPPAESTPEDIERAEALLRQAHLSRIRGNTAEARRLLEMAAATAPSAPMVLEALGDEYAEAGRHREAAAMYARAMRAAPGNIPIEKKHAQAVFNAEAAAAGMALARELQHGATAASGKATVVLSAFLPGLGQIVSERTALGVGIMVAWLASWIPLFLKVWGENPKNADEQVSGLDHLLSFAGWGNVASPNVLALVLFLCAAAVHVFAILEASVRSGPATPTQRPSRPVPPANLPFE